MKRFLRKLETIDVVPVADMVSGQIVRIGPIIGVCVTDIAAGELGAAKTNGVFLFDKLTMADTYSQGDTVNIVDATGLADAGGTATGVCVVDSAATDKDVAVYIQPGLL